MYISKSRLLRKKFSLHILLFCIETVGRHKYYSFAIPYRFSLLLDKLTFNLLSQLIYSTCEAAADTIMSILMLSFL